MRERVRESVRERERVKERENEREMNLYCTNICVLYTHEFYTISE